MPQESPRSRAEQLQKGSALWGQLTGLKGWYQHLPSKPYPMSLKVGDVKFERQEQPTVKGGSVEIVTNVSKGGSYFILCSDGRILIDAYTDVQEIDPEMYEKAVKSVASSIESAKAEEGRKVEAAKENVKGRLAAFL